MNNEMTCHDVQNRFQQMLDHRTRDEIPSDLQRHLQQCPACQAWSMLLQFSVPGNNTLVPHGFADRVLQRHHQEKLRTRWFRGSVLMALAASIVICVLTWISFQSILSPNHPKTPDLAKVSAQETIENWKQELTRIGTRSSRVVSITVPENFYSWELPEFDDSLSIALPAFRNVGNTLQSAVEPFEAPARAAIQKVKNLVDDPELRKWVSTVRKRLT